MGKLIALIIIVTLLCIIGYLLKDLINGTKVNFSEEVDRLRFKILKAKAQIKEGIEGAEADLEEYIKQLQELEEFNNKIKQ